LTVVAILKILLQQTAAEIGAAHLGAGAPRRRFGALIASAMGKDKNARRRRPGRKMTAM
jgi:hypothetical protein